MKAVMKSLSLTQKGDVKITIDGAIIGRRLVENAYVITEDDNFTVSLKEWRRALHNYVSGADVIDGVSAQDAINTVLDSTDINRRVAAATATLNKSIVEVEAVEFVAGEQIAQGYVAQHDGVRYDITSIILNPTSTAILKLQWMKTMGL